MIVLVYVVTMMAALPAASQVARPLYVVNAMPLSVLPCFDTVRKIGLTLPAVVEARSGHNGKLSNIVRSLVAGRWSLAKPIGSRVGA